MKKLVDVHFSFLRFKFQNGKPLLQPFIRKYISLKFTVVHLKNVLCKVTWATEDFDKKVMKLGRERLAAMSLAEKCCFRIDKHYSKLPDYDERRPVEEVESELKINFETPLDEWADGELTYKPNTDRQEKMKLRPYTKMMIDHGKRHYIPFEQWPADMEAFALGLASLKPESIPTINIGYLGDNKVDSTLSRVSIFHCNNHDDAIDKRPKSKRNDGFVPRGPEWQRHCRQILRQIEAQKTCAVNCGKNIIRRIEMSVRSMIHSGAVRIGFPPCSFSGYLNEEDFQEAQDAAKAGKAPAKQPLFAAYFVCSDHVGAMSRAVLRALPSVDVTVAHHVTYRRLTLVDQKDACLTEPRLVVKFRSRSG